MNLDDEPKRELSLPDPKTEINDLLIAAQHLYAKPEWRTAFPELRVGKGLLSSARYDLQRCISSLHLIVEGEG